MTTRDRPAFVPLADDPTRKACPACGQRVPIAAPEPIYHRCGPRPACRPRRDRGLGDTLARIARWFGLPACGGCKGRAATLNQWFPYAEGKAQERAAARLEICGGCDQRIGRACTMTAGGDLVDRALDAGASCPLARWPGEAQAAAPRARPPRSATGAGERWLVRFPHGLGDTVQLLAIVAHLRQAWPDLAVEVLVRPGAAGLFRGLADASTIGGDPPAGPFTQVIHLAWREPARSYPDAPSTKTAQCLRDVFGLRPVQALCRYRIAPDPAVEARAAEALARLAGGRPAVAIHPRGRCGCKLKDLPDEAVAAAVAAVVAAGGAPLLLDFDRKLPLSRWPGAIDAAADPALWTDGPPGRPAIGCAAALAALAARCALCLGVDSGPGHLFGAVDTPTLIVWRKLHPINYFDLAEHVEHWIPPQHGQYVRGDRATALDYFARHYRHRVYAEADLAGDLAAAIREALA